MDNTTNQQYSFWKRPEGTTGKYVLGLIGIGAVYAFIHFLPNIIGLAENMVYLGILVGTLAVMFMIATSDRVHTLIQYGFEGMMRAITSNFVDLDPVSILRTYSKEMRKRGEVVDDSLNKILGVKSKLDQTLAQCTNEMNAALKRAGVAQSANQNDALAIQTEIAGRRSATIDDLTQKRQVILEIVDALTHVKKVVEYQLANSDDEMNQLIRDNELAKSMADATGAAGKVLSGYNDMYEVKNMAADRIRDKYGSALGQLDGLIQSTKSLDSEVDLNSLSFQADGKQKLAELRKKLGQVDGPTDVKMLDSGAVNTIGVPAVTSPWADRLHSQN